MNKIYESHPATCLFPQMPEAELAQLQADIKQHGLRQPITIYDGKIIDGRNRYAACMALDIEPDVMDMTDQIDDVISYVVSANLHRRHLTASQRAMVAITLANMAVGNPHGKKTDSSVSQQNAATLLSVSKRTLSHAKKVNDSAIDKIKDLVNAGKLSVSVAAEVAQLPANEQDKVKDAKSARAVVASVITNDEKQIKTSIPVGSGFKLLVSTLSGQASHDYKDMDALLNGLRDSANEDGWRKITIYPAWIAEKEVSK